MPPKRPATLRALRLGERLRQLRRAVGLSQAEVADLIGGDHTALSRRERAELPFPRNQVEELLNLYAVHSPRQRDEITRLARDIWHTHHFDDSTPGTVNRCHDNPADMSWLTPAWLEAQSRSLRVYEANLVPPLLRTTDYANACQGTSQQPHLSFPLRAGHPDPWQESQEEGCPGGTPFAVHRTVP
jgi:DNA-binding XRE family transcriptional regulator